MALNDLSLKSKLWILLGTLTLLSITDFCLTKNFVTLVGPVGEANPVMRSVIDNFGINGILGFKLLVSTIFALGIWRVAESRHQLMCGALFALNFVYLIPVTMGFYAVSTTF